MDWKYGFSAAYYASFVDPDTWNDIERFEITAGSIQREAEELRGSADMTCTDYEEDRERWIRIWLDARQGSGSEHIALFTGIATSPGRDLDGNFEEHKLECYSVLKPCEDVLLPRGWYLPAGSKGADAVLDLLDATPAPVEVASGSPRVQESIIAEDGETNLSMIDAILTAIGWRLRITGEGTIQILPEASGESAGFDALDNDVVEPKISVEKDWYECPNVFRAISNELSAVARDDSEESPLSTVSRGREVWMEEDGVELPDNETIAEYAARRLKEEQKPAELVSYTRRFYPDVLVGDNVRLHYPGQSIDGVFRVKSQSITLGYGASTDEEAERV